jgi:hypothetical protein
MSSFLMPAPSPMSMICHLWGISRELLCHPYAPFVHPWTIGRLWIMASEQQEPFFIRRSPKPGSTPTVRTHFNPTFWTAFWNHSYYHDSAGKRARDQVVHVLSLPANKVYCTKVENVHVERGLGLAPVQWADLMKWEEANLSIPKLRRDANTQISSEGTIDLGSV